MITRDIFLYLAKQDGARRMIMRFDLSRRAAMRFVAGEDLPTALRAVSDLNRNGILSTLDVLGEDVTSSEDVLRVVSTYETVLDEIGRQELSSNVSLKLSQLGMKVGRGFCESCVDSVLTAAARSGNFVRIDMEDSTATDQTLEIYRRLRERHDNVGVVIQACLYRSAGDIERLIAEGKAHIRLCKGAYQEPASVAFPRKIDVDRNYRALMEKTLSPEARAQGAYLAVASHDRRIIDAAKQLAQENDIPRDSFEFQMLYGVRRDIQRQLAAEGYKVRVYVPFGQHWYPYFMRRLAERPANVLFLTRAVLSEWRK